MLKTCPSSVRQLTMIYWVNETKNADIISSQLLLLQVATVICKQILSPLLPKRLWNGALPANAQVLPCNTGTAAILLTRLSTSILYLSNPGSPLLPKHPFKNFRNAHVLPLLLKTLKSLNLQDKLQTTYLK